MTRTTSHLVAGLICVVIGGGLVVFAGDVTTPVVTLSKVGVVLLVIGALDLSYGIYLAVRKGKQSS